MDKTSHAYIAEEGTNSQSLLYRWVTPNSSVLDVGCAVGDMGAALNRNKKLFCLGN